VNKRLRVPRNSSTAIALPMADSRGESARTAISAAAMISRVPGAAASACWVRMRYSQVVGDQRMNGSGLVAGELQRADPGDNDDDAVAGQLPTGYCDGMLGCPSVFSGRAWLRTGRAYSRGLVEAVVAVPKDGLQCHWPPSA
jgi:hypothetical protein